MKKVILINPKNYNRSSFRPPFGLMVVSGKFKENGVEVIWVDIDATGISKGFREIRKHADADLIAMGGMHTAYKSIKEICTRLWLENIKIPIIVGGRVAWTLKSLLIDKIEQISMICSQEGEYVIDSICKNWPNIENIKGISYRVDGTKKFIHNPPAPLTKTLAEWPRLEWDMLSSRYFNHPGDYIIYLASVGCPFKCSFCRMVDSPAEKVKYLPVETVLEDVAYLTKKHRKKGVLFVDDFFLVKRKRVWEFCEKLEQSSLNGKLEWQGNSRVDAISEKSQDLLKYMSEVGCTALNFGFESGSPTVLKAMNKKADIQRAEYAINSTRRAGITVKGTFIFGHPGETEQTALETLKWREKMKLGGGHFHAQPYPGSTLYRVFKEQYNIDTLDKEEEFICKGISIKRKDKFINFTNMSGKKYKRVDSHIMQKLSKIKLPNDKEIARFFEEEENITRAKIYTEVGEDTGLL